MLKKQIPWKLYTLTTFTILSLIVVNCVPPVKEAFFHLGVFINSAGWFGPICLMLFNGLIVIPLCLPYIVFEMIVACLIKNFFCSLFVSVGAKVIGASISYFITKRLMGQKIHDYLLMVKAYKGIQHAMEKNPFKFSLIFRVIVLPLFLKNYGLAIPKTIDFKLYIFCVIVTSIPVTSLNIYLLRQAGAAGSLVDGSKSLSQLGFAGCMVLLSVCLFIYSFIYTKRILSEIEKKENEKADPELICSGMILSEEPIKNEDISLIEEEKEGNSNASGVYNTQVEEECPEINIVC